MTQSNKPGGDKQQTNPKDRNFDQEQVSGASTSTNGKNQDEEEQQDDYNAQDRNFDHRNVSGEAGENIS